MKEIMIEGESYYRKRDVDILLRSIRLEGWKGSDIVEIYREGNDWIVEEHRKDKETKEVANVSHTIPHDNVVFTGKLIEARCKGGRSTRYRELALDIITGKHLPISIEEFNGGKNRAKHYFPLYYYPVKILEYTGAVRYGGRGTIVWLGAVKA